MTFLPIVARELRVASRRPGTYWVRLSAAVGLIAAGTWLFLALAGTPPHEVSLVLFRVMTGGAVLFGLAGGVWATADALSEEKREGTLGLLFLTHLKGYDVVLGKLAATSLNACYGMVAVLPLLAVPLLMGGLTVGEFGRMALVAGNTLLLSLALGICVSAMSRSARTAMGTTLLALVLLTGLLPAAGMVQAVRAGTFPTRVGKSFLIASPGRTYYLAWEEVYRIQAKEFWQALVFQHGLAWVWLGLASVMAPRTWQDQPGGAQGLRWRERVQRWTYGDTGERKALRSRLLGANAFFWLAARARFKPAAVWVGLGLLGCGWVWGLAKLHRAWLSAPIYFMTGAALNLVLKTWFASEAGRQLAEERKQGTLELLLSTPLTVREVLRGQRLALQRQFLGPILTVLVVEITFMLLAPKADEMDDADRRSWLLLCIGGMLTLPSDLIALYWVGMWKGLTTRNPTRAAGASFSRILVLPAVVFGVAALAVSFARRNVMNEPSQDFFLALWFGLGLAADIGFGAWARHRLLRDFRQAAARRYARGVGFWKRLLAFE